MFTIWISTIHCTSGHSHWNKSRERNKRPKDWKERNKTVITCTTPGCVGRTLKRTQRQTGINKHTNIQHVVLYQKLENNLQEHFKKPKM